MKKKLDKRSARDLFALAAMPIAYEFLCKEHDDHGPGWDRVARTAYGLAEFMMREREGWKE